MKYCKKCGRELSDIDKFCPTCGTPAEGNGSNISDDLNGFINTKPKEKGNVSNKSRAVAAILACPFVIGLGMLGIHQFYLGNTSRGLTYLLLTLLLFWLIIPVIVIFILSLIDFITILTGDAYDSDGKQLVNW